MPENRLQEPAAIHTESTGEVRHQIQGKLARAALDHRQHLHLDEARLCRDRAWVFSGRSSRMRLVGKVTSRVSQCGLMDISEFKLII